MASGGTERRRGGTVSLLSGGPQPDPAVRTLAESLIRAAQANLSPNALSFVSSDGNEINFSYVDLVADADRIRTGLHCAGVRTGDLVLLHLADGVDLIAAFWACVLGGFVAAPVRARPTTECTNGLDALEQAWRTLGCPWVISGVDDPVGRIGRRLPEMRELRRRDATGDRIIARPHDPAVVLLTSGSSGSPKAVLLSHRAILARSAGNAAANALSAGCRTVNWMPLEHASGLLMFHLRDVYLGCHQLHASHEWVIGDPLRWLDLIDQHRADITWGTSSAFDLLMDHIHRSPRRSWDLSCLRYVMIGGEGNDAGSIRRILAVLGHFGLRRTALRPGWGMTETSSGIVEHRLDSGFSDTFDSSSDATGIVPAGKPQPGITVRVVDNSNRVMPVDTVGHLQVRGDPVADGYLDESALTTKPLTVDGWLPCGDLGSVSGGELTVFGGPADVIINGVEVLYTKVIEATIDKLAAVTASYTVVCDLAHSGVGNPILAIWYLPNAGEQSRESAWIERKIRDVVQCDYGLEVRHVIPITPGDLPRTGTGRVQRGVLRAALLAVGDQPARAGQ